MKALTANRLSDGEVVVWKAGTWVERLAEADVFGAEDEAATAETSARAQPTLAIDPYLIDLVETAGFWTPVSYRERIRALGPSNHERHGKQADGGDAVEALRHAHGAARSSGRVNLIRRK